MGHNAMTVKWPFHVLNSQTLENCCKGTDSYKKCSESKPDLDILMLVRKCKKLVFRMLNLPKFLSKLFSLGKPPCKTNSYILDIVQK